MMIDSAAVKSENIRRKKRTLILAVAICLALVVLGVFGIRHAKIKQQIKTAQDAINAIGTVSLDSANKIVYAETVMGELSEDVRAKVENAWDLTNARKTYDEYVRYVVSAKSMINDLPDTITVEDEDRIKNAREAYEGLKKYNLESHVADVYQKLTTAETDFYHCYGSMLIAEAQNLHAQEKYQEAVSAYDTAIAEYPDKADECKTMAAECVYTLAKQKFDEGKLEETQKLLDKSDQSYGSTDAAKELEKKLNTKLEKIRPRSGHVFKNTIPKSHGELTLKAGNQDVYVKVESTESDKRYAIVYVQANQSKMLKVVDGTYNIKVTSGNVWFGQEDMFGETASYKMMKDGVTFESRCPGTTIYYSCISVYLDRIYENADGTITLAKTEF